LFRRPSIKCTLTLSIPWHIGPFINKHFAVPFVCTFYEGAILAEICTHNNNWHLKYTILDKRAVGINIHTYMYIMLKFENVTQ